MSLNYYHEIFVWTFNFGYIENGIYSKCERICTLLALKTNTIMNGSDIIN